jgi:hypothetical protein
VTRAKAAGPALRDVARLLGAYLGAVAAVSAALLVLDSVPALLLGGARGVRVHATVEAAERALGARLLVPAYFPEAYRWPPRLVRTAATPVRVAALTLASRDDGRPDLVVVQSLDGDAPVPAKVLPRGTETHVVGVDLGGTPATLTDVLLPPDGTFYDLSLVAGGRRVVFRFKGPPEDVIRMAASMTGRAR